MKRKHENSFLTWQPSILAAQKNALSFPFLFCAKKKTLSSCSWMATSVWDLTLKESFWPSPLSLSRRRKMKKFGASFFKNIITKVDSCNVRYLFCIKQVASKAKEIKFARAFQAWLFAWYETHATCVLCLPNLPILSRILHSFKERKMRLYCYEVFYLL